MRSRDLEFEWRRAQGNSSLRLTFLSQSQSGEVEGNIILWLSLFSQLWHRKVVLIHVSCKDMNTFVRDIKPCGTYSTSFESWILEEVKSTWS